MKVPAPLDIRPGRIEGFTAVYLIADMDYELFYVGISVDPYKRFIGHKFTKRWKPVHLHIIKYVLSCQAAHREKYWIKTFLEWNFHLKNKSDGGEYLPRGIGRKVSEVTKAKLRRIFTGSKRPDVSNRCKGKKGVFHHTAETKEKLRKAGKNRSKLLIRKWVDASISVTKGVPLSTDHRSKISATMKDFWNKKRSEKWKS